jgi:hypothetical protein
MRQVLSAPPRDRHKRYIRHRGGNHACLTADPLGEGLAVLSL